MSEGRCYAIASNDDIVPQIRTGQANFALLGTDKFDELGVTEDLGYELVGKLPCSFVLAAPVGVELPPDAKIATSYPSSLKQFLGETMLDATVGPILKGKVESAPARGLADAIFDIEESGDTMVANRLEVVKRGRQIELGGLWLKELDAQGFNAEGFFTTLEVIGSRQKSLAEGKSAQTYTEKLLESQNEQVKKLSSEAGELVREICRPDFSSSRFIAEASDLVYAIEVACAAQGISFISVLNELAKRNNNTVQ